MGDKKGHPYRGGGWKKGIKRGYSPHLWNLTKKGTFQKGHIQPIEVRKKLSNTRLERFTKEQLKNFGILANLKTKPKWKNTTIELIISKFLNLINIGFISQYKEYCFNFDFWVIGQNKVIECDGTYWHSERFKDRDLRKNEYCRINNIQILRLPEWEIKNNPNLCINKILNFLKQ